MKTYRKNSRNADAFALLPKEFTTKDVQRVLDKDLQASSKQCSRWLLHGFIERIKQGKYRKLVTAIVV